uniref:Cystatin domain-containing protein n=1 Tax=Salvator merianae TaxID=96440 RepID=A0A8D0C4Z2_SALMN
MMTGGLSDVQPATPDIQKLADQVSEDFNENKENQSYPIFRAVDYKTQVVAGTNYFIKVDIGQGNYIHLRIFLPLPHTNEGPSLTSFQTGKVESDPLNYFD